MTSRIAAPVVTAGLVFWWAPTFAGAVILAAPHLAAGLGTPYRLRRVQRLIARGDRDEAGRVLAAIKRDQAVTARWLRKVRR